MDHQNIEDELIIEKYVAGELDPEVRREFFEHCLSCPECAKSVLIARLVDDSLSKPYTQNIKGQMTSARPIRKLFPALAGAAVVTLALTFIGGYYFRENRIKIKPEIVQGPPDTVQNDTAQTVPVKSPKENKVQVTVNESEPKVIKVNELIAALDVLLKLSDINDKLVTGAGLKGGSSSIKVDKFFAALNEAALIVGEFQIIKPLEGEKVKAGQSLNVEWNIADPATLILLNQDVQKVMIYQEDIKGMKCSLNNLISGNYYLVIFNQSNKNWVVISFTAEE
jgi:hypothetical protein